MWLSNYLDEMESLLRLSREQLIDKITKRFGTDFVQQITKDQRKDLDDLPWRTHLYRYLRNSFIVLLVSFSEERLLSLCDFIGSRQKISSENVKKEIKDIRKNSKIGNIEATKVFIEKHVRNSFCDTTVTGFIDWINKSFEPILDMVKIRNCLVHEHGRGRKKLDGFEKKYKGFSIINDLIKLDDQFCKNRLKDVNDLIVGLLEVVN